MILADTHVLLWAAEGSSKLSAKARELILAAGEQRWFSAASIWEAAIKRARRPSEFDIDVVGLRRELLENDWRELAVTGEHAIAVLALPPIHKDPFDRMLVAQMHVEGLTLLTSDKTLAKYPGAVLKV